MCRAFHKYMKGTYFMKIIPIDIAKFHHCASVTDDRTGEVLVSPFYFDNNAEGFHQFYSKIKKYCNAKHLIGLEATGHYGDNLINFLLDKKCTVALINPIVTKNEAKKNIRKTKTDKIDTFVIAKVLKDKDNPYTIITKQKSKMKQAKELTRNYHSRVEDLNRYKNQLQKQIDTVFPEYNKIFKTKYSKAYMAVLKEFGSAYNVSKAHLTHLKKVLNSKGRGSKASVNASDLRNLANKSIGSHDEAAVFEIAHLIGIIELIEEQLSDYKKKIEELATTLNSPIFTIPGIGYITGLSILSEINDIKQFSKISQLIAYAGVDPSVHDSGEFSSSRGSISKRGSPYLRKSLYQAVLPLCLFNPTFNTYYKLKRSQGKSHRCASGHVVRKLLRVIYALLNDPENKAFDSSLLK